ncbi:MAG: cell division protein FtsL [Dongiaceae bacterium]
MITRGTMIWIALSIVAGVALFEVTYRVQALEEELAKVNREIVQEREALHVLRAEWSYLNEPGRLSELARRHLDLAPLQASQMTQIDNLPYRLPKFLADLPASADGEITNFVAADPAQVPQ